MEEPSKKLEPRVYRGVKDEIMERIGELIGERDNEFS